MDPIPWLIKRLKVSRVRLGGVSAVEGAAIVAEGSAALVGGADALGLVKGDFALGVLRERGLGGGSEAGG